MDYDNEDDLMDPVDDDTDENLGNEEKEIYEDEEDSYDPDDRYH